MSESADSMEPRIVSDTDEEAGEYKVRQYAKSATMVKERKLP